MTPARLERLAERLFPYRWGLVALSLTGIAGFLGLALVRRFEFPLLLTFGSWWLFCACVWFHPTRGTMRPSAIPWRWLPGWARSAARAWAALVLTFAAAVTLFMALQMARPGRAGGTECSSHSVYQALVEDSFSRITRVSELPPAMLDTFWRAYGRTSEDRRIADPGEPFQSTDFVSKQRLPWRRLLFGGRSQRVAYLYYEKGGIALTRHLFAVCLGSPKSQGFSYVAPPSVDPQGGIGGALDEKCLISPPRERFEPQDRGTCF